MRKAQKIGNESFGAVPLPIKDLAAVDLFLVGNFVLTEKVLMRFPYVQKQRKSTAF